MENPTLKQTLVFQFKSKLLQLKRCYDDTLNPNYKKSKQWEHRKIDTELEVLAEHKSLLWTEDNPLERDLTAGKVQNLRIACMALNGLLIPANEVFSFWKNVGKTSSSKGYVVGRELREGCIIPNLGGGLCQLSNALYDAALKAELEVVERHAHSRVIDGSLASINRDATVFWNYVDLRFRSTGDFQIEAKLSKDQLIVRLLGNKQDHVKGAERSDVVPPVRAIEHLGNCYSCNVTSCFRNNQQTTDSVRFGRAAALVDAYTPEFDGYLNTRLSEDDYFFSPINGKRFKANAYRWNTAGMKNIVYSTAIALRRAYKLRKIPKQGRALQQTLLEFEKKLAQDFSKNLDYSVSHVIVSQNLLPHLWNNGSLGGRTFDVLANRLPLSKLQSDLDRAAKNNPTSTTLGDFRVDDELLKLENEALLNANKIITPHKGIAKLFGERSELLEWCDPLVADVKTLKIPLNAEDEIKVFFPASALGRKGIYELVEGVNNLGQNVNLHVLGKANEGESCPLKHLNQKVRWQHSSLDKMAECDVVVLPAYVEHSPRLLLKALTLEMPVIATKACGVSKREGLTLLEDPNGVINALLKFAQKDGSEKSDFLYAVKEA